MITITGYMVTSKCEAEIGLFPTATPKKKRKERKKGEKKRENKRDYE